MLNVAKNFNPCDLYSKGNIKPNVKPTERYYDDLFSAFLPGESDFVINKLHVHWLALDEKSRSVQWPGLARALLETQRLNRVESCRFPSGVVAKCDSICGRKDYRRPHRQHGDGNTPVQYICDPHRAADAYENPDGAA